MTSADAKPEARHPLVRFVGINKHFPGVQALKDVSLDVLPGEVHALCGENGAGKSTLMNILAGVYQPDSGIIEINGKPIKIRNRAQSLQLGISVVYQERSLVSNLSVAENIFADRQPTSRLGFIDHKEMKRQTVELCHAIQFDISPTTLVGDLLPANAQMVEIAKALSVKSDVLILDEPTATITEKETRALFDVIRGLRTRGISIIYISHRLREIFEIADRVTVLKDGRYVGTEDIDRLNVDDVIKMMVGRDLVVEQYRPAYTEERVLEVKNLTAERFADISFHLYHGEILTFAGLAGAGRTGVMRSLVGVDQKKSGEVLIRGQKAVISNFSEAVSLGFGFLPEDRKEQGLFMEMSIAANITSASLDELSRFKIVDTRKIFEVSWKLKNKLNIVSPGVKVTASQLSGGNQQKLIFAKWLLSQPKNPHYR